MRRLAIVALLAVVVLAALGWTFVLRQSPATDTGPWVGIDKTVIEKYAGDAGRPAWDPLINTDQGDLLLFLFAVGGAAGGFIAGYCWRKLISEKRKERGGNG